jgi:hypothetical protein
MNHPDRPDLPVNTDPRWHVKQAILCGAAHGDQLNVNTIDGGGFNAGSPPPRLPENPAIHRFPFGLVVSVVSGHTGVPPRCRLRRVFGGRYSSMKCVGRKHDILSGGHMSTRTASFRMDGPGIQAGVTN